MNPKRQKLIDTYYKNKIPDIEIFLDNFKNLHDISAIARSADGFGIKKIYLYYTEYDCPDLELHGKKSSASANKWIIYEEIKDLENFYKQKKDYTFTGIKKEKQNFTPLNKYTFPKKTILVIGSPQLGIAKKLDQKCTNYIYPPMEQNAEYSVSNYTAMTLYEIFTQLGTNIVPIDQLIERGKRE